MSKMPTIESKRNNNPIFPDQNLAAASQTFSQAIKDGPLFCRLRYNVSPLFVVCKSINEGVREMAYRYAFSDLESSDVVALRHAVMKAVRVLGLKRVLSYSKAMKKWGPKIREHLPGINICLNPTLVLRQLDSIKNYNLGKILNTVSTAWCREDSDKKDVLSFWIYSLISYRRRPRKALTVKVLCQYYKRNGRFSNTELERNCHHADTLRKTYRACGHNALRVLCDPESRKEEVESAMAHFLWWFDAYYLRDIDLKSNLSNFDKSLDELFRLSPVESSYCYSGYYLDIALSLPNCSKRKLANHDITMGRVSSPTSKTLISLRELTERYERDQKNECCYHNMRSGIIFPLILSIASSMTLGVTTAIVLQNFFKNEINTGYVALILIIAPAILGYPLFECFMRCSPVLAKHRQFYSVLSEINALFRPDDEPELRPDDQSESGPLLGDMCQINNYGAARFALNVV